MPIRTPTTAERLRLRRTPFLELSPLLTSSYELPVSTAPPKPGREERKRPHTKKYQESRAMDEIAEIEICDTKGVYTKPTVTSSYVSIDSYPMLRYLQIGGAAI